MQARHHVPRAWPLSYLFQRLDDDNMKTYFATALSCALLLAGSAIGAAPPKYPKAPGLTYLYQVNITGGDAAVVGKGPRGVRIVVPILFGSFEGPRLKGELAPCPCFPREDMLTQDTR